MLYHLQSFLAQQLNTSWTICKIKCAINIIVKQCDFNIHLNKTLTSKFRIRFLSFFFLCESFLFSSQLWWIPGRPEPAKETEIPNIFAACPATETSDDISVRFANCRPNWRHSEYYSCQTVQVKSVQSALSYLKRLPKRLQSQCNYRPFIT